MPRNEKFFKLPAFSNVPTRIERRFKDSEARLKLEKGPVPTTPGSKPLNLELNLSRLQSLWSSTLATIRSGGNISDAASAFFDIFQINLMHTLNSLKKVLKSGASADICDWRSKLTIRIVYIYEELQAIFPNGIPVRNYPFTMNQVGEWWKGKFGEQFFASWPAFVRAFADDFGETDPQQIMKLNSTISFTSESYVSVFQLDLFSRLFAPWERVNQVWTTLVCDHPGYMAWMTFDGMRELLSRYKLQPGTYAFRISCTQIGFWCVGYVQENGNIAQSICRERSLTDYLEDGRRQGRYVKPVGDQIRTDRGDPTKTTLSFRITMGKLEDFSGRESFEVCSICMVNIKSVLLEPCKHLLCNLCSTRWLKKENNCPFCRSTVSSSRSIKLVFPEPSLLTPPDSRTGTLSSTPKTPRSPLSPRLSSRANDPLPPLPLANEMSSDDEEVFRDSQTGTLSSTPKTPRSPPSPLLFAGDSRTGTLSSTPKTPRSPPSPLLFAGAQTNRPKIIIAHEDHLPMSEEKIERLASTGRERRDIIRALEVARGDEDIARRIIYEFL